MTITASEFRSAANKMNTGGGKLSYYVVHLAIQLEK